MPELPEVEAVARTLRPLVRGRRIERCRVYHRIAARPQSASELAESVEGQRIEEVDRRGKFLLLRLVRGCLILHFRLDGQLVWFDSTERLAAAAESRPQRVHVDAALELDRGVLGFADRRHFGRVNWVASPEHVPGLARLGVEPLSPKFTPGKFAEIAAAARRPLKLLLMDQSRIAGLGNIYASESLWHARLDPRRRANRLDAREARRLQNTVVDVLRRALECCLDPAPDFRDPAWWFAGLEKILGVYGREGKSCRRCGAAVARIAQGGRSTYFCRRCQK